MSEAIPAVMKTLGPTVALVRRDLLLSAWLALTESKARRAGAKAGRVRKAPLLYAFRIDTKLRFMARKNLPFIGVDTLARHFHIHPKDMTRTVKMLAKCGVKRGDGPKGTWKIAMPKNEVEVKAKYVAIPEVAIDVLDNTSFVVLALIHEWGEDQLRASVEGNVSTDPRKTVLHLAGDVSVGVAGKSGMADGIGTKTMYRCLHTLTEHKFVAPAGRGHVVLTPTAAQTLGRKGDLYDHLRALQ